MAKTVLTSTQLPPSILDRPLRVLHLEDNPDDREMVQRSLKAANIAADFTSLDRESEFVRALTEQDFDIILSDKALPGFDGMTALNFVREKFSHIPFVFVTGSMGEEAAIETMKRGATDYVLKDRLSRLVPALQRALRESEKERKNRQSEEKVRQQAALLDNAQDAIMVQDLADHILFWNKSAERIYGWQASNVIGRKASEILTADHAKYHQAKQLLLEKGNWTGELTLANRGGNERVVESRWTLMRDNEGTPKSVLIIDTDITERKLLETRYLRSQRLDSIGALAGGVAHDLNNALAPVIIASELLRSRKDTSGQERLLDIIDFNAQRATGLVQQILNFAKGTRSQSGPIQLRKLFYEMGRMIQDTFPKSIFLSIKLPPGELWTIHGDTTEVHQVLLNLCVNARDAMPGGGRMTIVAENFVLEADKAAAANAQAGCYVMMSVADSGTGIPPEVLPRIFEPFFTTKKGERGTGLGLATIAEIVKRHGGFIDLKTEPGQGTEFRVYFPAIESTEAEEGAATAPTVAAGHGELIFLIDDESILLELAKNILENFGYQVMTAPDGLQGIARFREHQDEIKLVITDSDMPHMDGMAVIRAIREMKSDLPVVLASGSKVNPEGLQAAGSGNIKTLGKPYTFENLLKTVEGALRR